MNNPQTLTNQELLKELAQRIVTKQLELQTPAYLIQKYEEQGFTAEQIIDNLKKRMNLYNQDGYALTNICEIYDEQTNRNHLNLNYFLMESKNNLTNHD
ncbi:MAG: Acireductone dioxygenase [Mycoplasmataceae bacterium]|nr:MAG: Acireductone dioxygenase [Mycoplasmataceae bacterium]